MDLSLDNIHTYLACPAKYKFKYVDKIQLEESKNVIYKKAVHETVYYFFFSVMGGRIPTSANMKDKWAKVWSANKDKAVNPMDIIMKTTPGFTYRAKEQDKHLIQGMEMIHNFYHFNHKVPGVPIAVDQDYRLSFDGVNVIGKFELIREILDESDGKRYIEIVDFKTNDDNVDPFLVKNDLNMSLASYAFKNVFGATEDRMKYHYLKTGRDIITVRRETDYNRAKAVVKGVANGIKNSDFYPRQSFACKTCEFRDVCDRVKY